MELNKKELDSMIEAFRKAGLEPKADSPQDFKTWVQGLSEQEITPVIKKESVSEDSDSRSKPPVTYHSFPKLPFFSGEPGKDAEYDLWHYEVECLMDTKTYSEETVLQAIRKSLKGEAALAAMKLGHKASTSDILAKLKSAFGTLRRSSVLMSKFYSASQGENEDVSAWSCRLERLLYQLAEQKSIPEAEQDEMLRTRLWDGLTPALKSLAGYKYDSIATFDDLRLCLREMEFDMRRDTADVPKTKSKQATANSATASATASSSQDFSEIKSMFKEMRSEFTEMKNQQKQMTAQIHQLQSPAFTPYPEYDSRSTPYRRGPRMSRGRGHYTPSSEGWFETGGPSPSVTAAPTPPSTERVIPPTASASQSEVPTCWRCGYPGHLAYGCRVRLDHRRRPLNWNRPMGRGRY